MSIVIADDSRGTATRVASVKDIDCRLTTIWRETSGARSKTTLFEKYLEWSEPPKVKLPKTPFNPEKNQYQPQHSIMSISFGCSNSADASWLLNPSTTSWDHCAEDTRHHRYREKSLTIWGPSRVCPGQAGNQV